MSIHWRTSVALDKYCWFGCGGPAGLFCDPESEQDLVKALEEVTRQKMPYFILGAGSNVLIRKGGIEGATLRIGKGLTSINEAAASDCNNRPGLVVGSGLHCPTVAMAAAKREITGMEFLIGIPGSIGGAISMNAGCYGSDMKDILESVTIWLPETGCQTVEAKELSMAYRRGNLPPGGVVLSAVLRGASGDGDAVRSTISCLRAKRRAAQPIVRGTGGSTFRNPYGPNGEPKAWQLISQAGCSGLRVDGAHISDKHCNFIINIGRDPEAIESLGEIVRDRVKARTGYDLEWEIHRLGSRQDRNTQV